MAATKVKGFFKGGFEHVKDIFVVTKEEEHEMQIGLPTDVKHVAHIGIDGGSSVPQEKPSWMNEFHGDSKSTEQPEKKERSKGRSRPSPLRNSSDENAQPETKKPPKKKKRRKHRDSSDAKPSKTKGKKSSSDGDI